MDKYDIKGILEQVCEEEFSEFSNPTEHKFRLKNRIRMRRILSRFKRNSTVKVPVRRMNRRLVTAIVIVILLAVMAVTATAILLLKGFIAKEHEDNTQLFAENIAGAPTTIEEIYYIPELPEGYECIDIIALDTNVSTTYYNQNSNFINLNQYVKSKYNTHYDNNTMYPIMVGEYNGVFIDHSSEQVLTCVIWDGGDYIFHLEGTMSKDEIMSLAESVKIK